MRSSLIPFLVSFATIVAPVLAQGPSYGGPSRGTTNFTGANGGGSEGGLGVPEFDPNWTTAGLVMLIGGAILLLASGRRRLRTAD